MGYKSKKLALLGSDTGSGGFKYSMVCHNLKEHPKKPPPNVHVCGFSHFTVKLSRLRNFCLRTK